MRIDGKMTPGMDGTDSASRSKKAGNKKGLTAKISDHNSKSAATDSVILSGKGKDTSIIAKSLKDLPDVRKDKVAELKAKVANGTYKVPGKAIAGKVVSSSVNGLF